MLLSELPERLQGKIRISGACWVWTGAATPDGYGSLSVSHAKTALAHRFVYELSVGPIPQGLQIDHLCRVTLCVNPAHLEAVTGHENMRRRYALLTHCKSGHEYTEDNTYIRPTGFRDCRACIRARVSRYLAKKRAA